MWNIVMWIWLIISMLSPIIILYRAFNKNKLMTWSESLFFLFGLFVGGVPSLYILHIVKLIKLNNM